MVIPKQTQVCNHCHAIRKKCILAAGSSSCQRCLHLEKPCSFIRPPPAKNSRRCELCLQRRQKCEFVTGEQDCKLCVKTGKECSTRRIIETKSTKDVRGVQARRPDSSGPSQLEHQLGDNFLAPPNTMSDANMDMTKAQGDRIAVAMGASPSPFPTSSIERATSASTVASSPPADESSSSAPPKDPVKAAKATQNYPGQPTILCCPFAKASSPICKHQERAIRDMTKKLGGTYPLDVTDRPKKKYTAIWTDYVHILGIASREPAIGASGVTWYGCDDLKTGGMVELMYQAPPVKTTYDGDRSWDECFVRGGSVDFKCKEHPGKKFTAYMVRWQAHGEALRRGRVKKLAQETGGDFETMMAEDRKEHMGV